MIVVCGRFCSPDGAYNSSCVKYGFFSTWDNHFQVLKGFIIVPMVTVGPFQHGDNPFQTVGKHVACVQSQELDLHPCLIFQGLSCWLASVTLYWWFRFQAWSMIAVCDGFCSLEWVFNSSCRNYRPFSACR